MKIKNIILLPIFTLLLSSCSFSFGPIEPDQNPDESEHKDGDDDTKPDPVDPTPEPDYFPKEAVKSFYDSLGITLTIPSIKLKYDTTVLDIQRKTYSYEVLEILLSGDYATSYRKELKSKGFSYYYKDGIEAYIDANNIVAIESNYSSYYSHSTFRYYRYSDLFSSDLDIHDYGTEIITFEDEFLPSEKLKDYSNLDGVSVTQNDIRYSFDKNSVSSPSYSSISKYVTLYKWNKLTIETNAHQIEKIIFHVPSDIEYKGTLTSSDQVELTYNEDQSLYTYEGSFNKTLTFTTSSTLVFESITLVYPKEIKIYASTDGVSSIADVKTSFENMEYTPDENGYYKSNQKVKLHVRNMQTIDSKSKTWNARGKTIVVDETGVILLSSEIYSYSEPSYYQVAKFGTRYLEVEGYVAFDQGRFEINVESYKYYSTMKITYSYDNIFDKEISSQEEMLNDLLHLECNTEGFASLNFVKFSDVYYYQYVDRMKNIYLDASGDIIPVYGQNSSLSTSSYADIFGLEVIIEGRPFIYFYASSEHEKEHDITLNMDNVIELESLDTINNYTYGSEEYRLSMFKFYKLDVYFSRFCATSYTMHTSYYTYTESGRTYYSTSKNLKTTVERGCAMPSSVDDNYLIDLASDEDAVKARKKTYYFTLGELDSYNEKPFWRVHEITKLNSTLS